MATVSERLRVVDFSGGIAAGYCTKLLSDAGADVVMVEGPNGDALRREHAPGASVDGDGVLFRYLSHGKRSVSGIPGDVASTALIASADIVVEPPGCDAAFSAQLVERHPALVVVSITPFGRTGPYAGRPATELTVQAVAGAILDRGLPEGTPFAAGGQLAHWFAGAFAAVGAMAAARRSRASGHGEYIDVSMAEAVHLACSNYANVRHSTSGGSLEIPHRRLDTPSIEQTSDGWVGICTNAPEAFNLLLAVIGRSDLMLDERLQNLRTRHRRLADLGDVIGSWTRTRTTEEVIKAMLDVRIPAVPVLSGSTLAKEPHFVHREIYVEDPTGSFVVPRRPWLTDGVAGPLPSAAPRVGEHTGKVECPSVVRTQSGTKDLPLKGLRIVDFTSWWAGPSSTWLLGALGAEVIHIESPDHLDAWRLFAAATGTDGAWWERAANFLAVNPNKRDVAFRINDQRGLSLLRELIASSDMLIENAVPKVIERFGLTWEALQELNQQLVMVRMPGFGLSGPWKDRPAFAQTIEQASGIAWVTGFKDDQPRVVLGPCDRRTGRARSKGSNGQGRSAGSADDRGWAGLHGRAGGNIFGLRSDHRSSWEPIADLCATGPLPL